MDEMKHGQLVASAAQIYEDFFVGSVFGSWAPLMLRAAAVSQGDTVLDVACGTGVVAREALPLVGQEGSVTGLDLNPEMLTIATAQAPAVRWENGPAEALPFPDNSFDRVLCQFGLMFFADKAAALREMARVLQPGGSLAVSVWDSLDKTPGYLRMAELVDHLFGAEMAAAFDFPFSLGDKTRLNELFAPLGLVEVQMQTMAPEARFPTLDDWLFTEVRGWTLADKLDDAQFAQLQTEAKSWLADFVQPDGTVRFPIPGHIVTGRKASAA